MAYYRRKPTRIPGYDYSTENYYFITICAYEKKCIFGKPEQLNEVGQIAQKCIEKISDIFCSVRVDNYVVMPNHIHCIITLEGTDYGVIHPSVSTVIGQYKMTVTKQVREIYPNMKVWQRSFHDHIIRNQKSYERIWNYVEYNAQKWDEDCFYTEKLREGQCPSPTE